MMTSDKILDAIIEKVSRPLGASNRELRDRFKATDGTRAEFARVRDLAERMGEIVMFSHRFPGSPKPASRYFRTVEQAQVWLSGTRAAPDKPKTKPAAPCKPEAVEYFDARYTVRELPAGYVSKLNPAESRAWVDSVV